MFKQLIIKILILTLLSPLAHSLNIAIEISADTASIDQKSLVSHYIGNVIFSQGNTTLAAHEIKITKDGESDYQIVALGNSKKPAQFTQNGIRNIHSHANKIIYFTQQQFIQLFGDAHLSQHDNTFNGEQINYDFDADKILMSGEGNNRVKLKIKL